MVQCSFVNQVLVHITPPPSPPLAPPPPPPFLDPMETGGMARISLLELMQSQSCDHSAESVAQKLLRHMAGLMTGNLGENFNMSQLVCLACVYDVLTAPYSLSVSLHQALKLPTEFVISLQMDEDLQKSVTTVSPVL